MISDVHVALSASSWKAILSCHERHTRMALHALTSATARRGGGKRLRGGGCVGGSGRAWRNRTGEGLGAEQGPREVWGRGEAVLCSMVPAGRANVSLPRMRAGRVVWLRHAGGTYSRLHTAPHSSPARHTSLHCHAHTQHGARAVDSLMSQVIRTALRSARRDWHTLTVTFGPVLASKVPKYTCSATASDQCGTVAVSGIHSFA